MRTLLALMVLLCVGGLPVATHAQTANKPSYYAQRRQNGGEESEASNIARIAPRSNGDSVRSEVKSPAHFLSQIDDFAAFLSLARIYEQGSEFEIPHLLFAIDTATRQVFFINTPRFELHERFLPELLGRPLEAEENKSHYESPNRRFILGTISHLKGQQEFVFEFWEGDKLTPTILRATATAFQQTFYAPIRFKANSTWHEEVARSIKMPHVTQSELIAGQPLMIFNAGEAVGRLVRIADLDDIDTLQSTDIALLKEVPLHLPPVAGVISERPSTTLSHVNVLTQNWNIPNLYLKDAEKILAPFLNRPLRLVVSKNRYDLTPVTEAEMPRGAKPVAAIKAPQPDVSTASLRPLSTLRAKDARVCGSKAANLGEVRARIVSARVPDGFCIPFAAFDRVMKTMGIDQKFLEQLESAFAGDAQKRRAGLLALQEKIRAFPLDPAMTNQWQVQWQRQLGGQGVFVRSSSNSEDLPRFSGAGLYTTVPNVINADDLAQAVKSTWASVFNFEAYETRRIAGWPLDAVKMSTFVQLAVDADLAGVLVTANPYDKTDRNNSYIAAKRGLGIRVVEGRKLAEQLMFNHRLQTVRILSRSGEETALQLDEAGGVIEVSIGTERVMHDDLLLKLTEVGKQIQMVFGQPQDIEWAAHQGQVIILQARPYIRY